LVHFFRVWYHVPRKIWQPWRKGPAALCLYSTYLEPQKLQISFVLSPECDFRRALPKATPFSGLLTRKISFLVVRPNLGRTTYRSRDIHKKGFVFGCSIDTKNQLSCRATNFGSHNIQAQNGRATAFWSRDIHEKGSVFGRRIENYFSWK
jgi:hypothetical protein